MEIPDEAIPRATSPSPDPSGNETAPAAEHRAPYRTPAPQDCCPIFRESFLARIPDAKMRLYLRYVAAGFLAMLCESSGWGSDTDEPVTLTQARGAAGDIRQAQAVCTGNLGTAWREDYLKAVEILASQTGGQLGPKLKELADELEAVVENPEGLT